MIWLTYDSQKLQDGLGSQAQRILSIYLVAHLNQFAYYHTPLFTTSRGVTQETVNRFNQLITLPSTPLPSAYETLEMDHFNLDRIKSLKSSHCLVKIVFVHQYLDRQPELMSDPCIYGLSWVESGIKPKLQPQPQPQPKSPLKIAIHIRRGDVSQSCNQNRFISLTYYLQCIEVFHQVLSRYQLPYQFHIYSEKSILEEKSWQQWQQWQHILGTSVQLHLDTDVADLFRELVNADIFLAGFSSLSYSAIMLRQKAYTFYPPFWHRYPSRAICIRQAQDLLRNFQN